MDTVVLLRPPIIASKWSHVVPVVPPLGVAYLAAAAREAGFSVRCVDSVGEAPFQMIKTAWPDVVSIGLSLNEIVRRVDSCRVLGISLMFSQEWPLARMLLKALRQACPDALFVAGGEHVSALAEFCLRDCAELDVCVVGEGEETFVELLRAHCDNRPLDQIAGLVYRNGSAVVRSRPRPRIGKLDDISWPAWDLIPMDAYLNHPELGFGVNRGRSMPIIASRGCPFQCTFCSNPQMWTTRWLARDPHDVVREMQTYIDRYQVQNFDFHDLTAVVRKDWLVRFCELILQRNLPITWQLPSGTRAEALDQEVLELMYRAGVRNVTYAPESGSESTLKHVKKALRLPHIKQSLRHAVLAGLNVKLNMVMGFPHETRTDACRTIRFLLEMAVMGVHDIYIVCFAPYPGSELFDQLQRSGQLPVLDDDYFLALLSYGDLHYSRSYSQYLSDHSLTAFRLGGMLTFYAASFASHPLRIYQRLYNFWTGKQESRLDMWLAQFIERWRRPKVTLEDIVVNAAEEPAVCSTAQW